MLKDDLQASIYKKIIHGKTGGGSQEDVMRRLLQNGSIGATLDEIYTHNDFEATERLIEKNIEDINETHRVVKEYIVRQKETYDFFNLNVIDDILCPTFDLTREEIEFLANTEPFQDFN
ncbi:hypothetical protein [Candidatus Enterococcus clewellii]|uniref:Uncharacterized protein n=1 Tax=Candidatus Enterococcus clewellii TaxID=1834193 RepID=A0AAQ3VYP1_9ENTE